MIVVSNLWFWRREREGSDTISFMMTCSFLNLSSEKLKPDLVVWTFDIHCVNFFRTIWGHLCWFKMSMSLISVKSPGLGFCTGMDFFPQIIEMSGREIRLWRSIFCGVKKHGKIIGIIFDVLNNSVAALIWVKVVIVGLRLQDGGLFIEIILNNRSIDESL